MDLCDLLCGILTAMRRHKTTELHFKENYHTLKTISTGLFNFPIKDVPKTFNWKKTHLIILIILCFLQRTNDYKDETPGPSLEQDAKN